MAGVIPVIFAASVMAIPPTLGQLIGQNRTGFGTDLYNFFSPGSWHYIVGEAILIILFTYFYTAVTFNPVDQADNLKKYGGFIPGVRPGRPTAEFLDRILARLTFPGALFLAAVAALPTILINSTGRQLQLRRHLDHHRHRRRPGHDEAARGAADDAQLRGLPQVAPPCGRWGHGGSAGGRNAGGQRAGGPHVAQVPADSTSSCSAPRGRQGHSGRAPARGLPSRRTSPLATCCARTSRSRPSWGSRPRSSWTTGDLVPDDVIVAMVGGSAAPGRCAGRLHPRRVPAHARAGDALDGAARAAGPPA